MFVAKALEYTLRRVVLLTVNRSVLLQNTVDDIREGGQFLAFRWLASPISRRFRIRRSIFLTVSRAMPNLCRLVAGSDHQLWQASRTRRLGPRSTSSRTSISKKIEGYRWQSFTPPAAGKSRRFRGLICHRRSHGGRIKSESVAALPRNAQLRRRNLSFPMPCCLANCRMSPSSATKIASFASETAQTN